MLCRVEMPTNEQIFGRFYRYKFRHGAQGGRSGLFLMSLVVLVFCCVLLFSGGGFTLPVVLLVILAAYFLYILFLRPTSLFKQKGGAALQTEVTIFTPTGFNRSVTSEEGGQPETASMQYNALYMAVETRQDFYLYTGPSQAYLIDKEYFTKGSPEELRETLKTALGDKFKGK